MLPRVLFLHGFTCTPEVWDTTRTAVAGRAVAEAVTLPWHTGTDDPAEPSVDGLANAVAARHLAGREAAVVVGHSLGGMVGLHLARRHAASVRALVLVDAFPSLDLNDRVLPGMYGPGGNPAVEARAQSMMTAGRARMPVEGRDRLWASIRAMDAVPWLGELACPVLGVFGGRGRFGIRDAATVLDLLHLSRLPSCELVVCPAAGHFVMWDDSAGLGAALTRFLESLPLSADFPRPL